MIRNKNPASMQKTYDECYLICSTAVYFEGQGNEAEALRSWRSALDRIYYHNAYRLPANYKPQSETERALQESLRTMELQCKERVTLLEALRDSRKEADAEGSGDKKGKSASPKVPDSKGRPEPGWIGNGSVPATNYSDLVQPPLPARPSAPAMKSPEPSSSSPYGIDLHKPLTPNPPPPIKPSSRSPSPEKKGRLKTTLRDGKGKKPKPKAAPPRPQAASKAAGLAWDYKRVPSSSTTPRNNSYAEPRESLSEQESGRQSSRDSPRQETYGAPAPPPHVQPPYISGHGEPSGMPQRSERLIPISRQPHSDTRAGAPHSDNEATRKKAVHDMPPPPQLSYRNEYDPAPVSKASIAAAVKPPRGYEPDAPAFDTQRSPPADLTPQPIQRRPAPKGMPAKPGASRVPAKAPTISSDSGEDRRPSREARPTPTQKKPVRQRNSQEPGSSSPVTSDQEDAEGSLESTDWEERLKYVKKHLPKGVDKAAAKQIFNEIVVQGDEVHWSDIAGLDSAKNALKEAVVYPFLRPDLFMGLREPARGMLLFGPPGTGKTMLARAVATESRSTFFSISASSLTSKWLGDSEKLVRALFGLARALAPSIIFVDEIDSLLGSRGGSSEHEATRRVKTEFLIQWSDLQRAAAGKEVSQDRKEAGDPTRVLVLAATNMPWAIDDAARRRFVRRQYIPLPEREVRAEHLRTLLGHQKHNLNAEDVEVIVRLTDGYSGSDITALAKDAAMGPLRSLGEALLNMSSEQIRPIGFEDFERSLVNIRPSVGSAGLKEFEDWAHEYGERGG